MATKKDLDLIRAKVTSGHALEDKTYLVTTPVGRALLNGGVLESADNIAQSSRVRASDGKLYLLDRDGNETEEIALPQPFEMFGVRFERGIGVTDNLAVAERIAAEFAPHYQFQEM